MGRTINLSFLNLGNEIIEKYFDTKIIFFHQI